MSGAVSGVRTLGRQDLDTMINPEITFWKRVHKRHTPFQIEPKRFEFQNGLNYSQKNIVEVVRNCDLLSRVWLVFKLSQLDSGNGAARYVDDVGRAIIDKVQLEMGGTCFDELRPEYLHAYDELSVSEGKNLGILTGKSSSTQQLVEVAKNTSAYYVPLCFYFGESFGNALPIVALHLTDVRISVTLKTKAEIIVSSTAASYTVVDATDGVISDPHIMAECVFLDDPERKWFAENTHKYLITQTQMIGPNAVAANATSLNVDLFFNHPVKELIVLYRSTANKNADNWFNFVGNEGAGEYENEAFATMQLKLNNNSRFEARDPLYFRKVQPFEHHSRIPDKHVYVYSFAIHPEQPDPTGSLNFSRIDNARLSFTFSASTMVAGDFLVFARSLNVSHISSGAHLLRYSS